MYKSVKQTKPFDIMVPRDMAQYDEILNNPLATVIAERQVKKVEKIYSDGELVGVNEFIILVVTWEEKELI